MGSCSSHPDPNDLNNLENCRAYDKRNYVSNPPTSRKAQAYRATERKARERKAFQQSRSGGRGAMAGKNGYSVGSYAY